MKPPTVTRCRSRRAFSSGVRFSSPPLSSVSGESSSFVLPVATSNSKSFSFGDFGLGAEEQDGLAVGRDLRLLRPAEHEAAGLGVLLEERRVHGGLLWVGRPRPGGKQEENEEGANGDVHGREHTGKIKRIHEGEYCFYVLRLYRPPSRVSSLKPGKPVDFAIVAFWSGHVRA